MNSDSYVYYKVLEYTNDVAFYCRMKHNCKLKSVYGNNAIVLNYSKTFVESNIYMILRKKMNKKLKVW